MSELKQRTTAIVASMASIAIEGHMYSVHWGNDFRCKQIDKRIDQLLEREQLQITTEMLDGATKDILIDCGFRTLDAGDENDNVLMLLPIVLLPFIPKDYQLTSMRYVTDIDSSLPANEIDNDHRMGMLAYGILVPNTSTRQDEVTHD